MDFFLMAIVHGDLSLLGCSSVRAGTFVWGWTLPCKQLEQCVWHIVGAQ